MFMFYLRGLLISVVVLVVVSTAMSALGGILPRQTLQGFIEGCEGRSRLCWYGVVLHETPPDLVQAAFLAEGYALYGNTKDTVTLRNYEIYTRPSGMGCDSIYVGYDAQFVSPELDYLYLDNCHGISVGDLFDIFGAPDFILPMEVGGWLTFSNQVEITFGGQLRADARVTSISMSDDVMEPLQWQGFAPYWRYCQRAPSSYVLC